jgi:hypothetical protein
MGGYDLMGVVLKTWTGAAWVSKPAKAWSGSAWTTKPVKYWNGSAWVGGVAPATDTLDPATKSILLTLSGGNLTATAGADAGDGANARTTTSSATGKVYFECSPLQISGAYGNSVGVCNSGCASSKAITGSPNAIAVYFGSSSGFLFFNGLLYSLGGMPATVGIAVDRGAKLAWVTLNGTIWSGSASSTGNPVTGANGLDISSITGSLFAVVNAPTNGGQITANFGATAYAYTRPTGYGNWS